MNENINQEENGSLAEIAEPSPRKEEKKPAGDYKYYLYIALCGIIAAAGTCFMPPSKGIISSFPIMTAAAVICGFIKSSLAYKVGFFTLFSYFFCAYTSASSTTGENIFAAVTAALTVFLCSVAAGMIRKRSAHFAIYAPIIYLCTVLLYFLFAGTPFTAIPADKDLNEYFDKTYISDEYIKDPVRYDAKNHEYRLDFRIKNNMAKRYSISLSDGVVNDGFFDSDFAQIASLPIKNKITTAIREVYPSDVFNVQIRKISYLRGRSMSVLNAEEYRSACIFTIEFPSDITLEYFGRKVNQYLAVLAKEKINISSAVFEVSYMEQPILYCAGTPSFIPLDVNPVYVANERLYGLSAGVR